MQLTVREMRVEEADLIVGAAVSGSHVFGKVSTFISSD
jgi:hypothetical protein